jgi:hypothetical protein
MGNTARAVTRVICLWCGQDLRTGAICGSTKSPARVSRALRQVLLAEELGPKSKGVTCVGQARPNRSSLCRSTRACRVREW